MPANWTVSMNPPSKKEAQLIINAGVIKAKEIAQDILDDGLHQHVFNYPPTYSKFGFYKDYYAFKWLGVSNLWRNFKRMKRMIRVDCVKKSAQQIAYKL